ncbi:AraC family transcriptional regulator [Vibrio tapetis subsp. quintayensis]|uniref:helix-turn-helix domain-containing protein n=1 Tax=Vibrio tapetis TaxID=52443 RepID=UPI0025B5C975|nr:helix-turn-helix domain-containing protein [Vibrio tapetis]MDN3683000.1 AraC family transcriptional regulator [Vibrio tapetis subsp. quintayensis]
MILSSYKVPVMQTGYAKILVTVFSEYGLNLQKLLNDAGLPADLFQSDSDFIPLEPIKRLIYLMSLQLGVSRLTDLLSLALREHIVPQLLPVFSKYKTINEALADVDVIFAQDSPGNNVQFEEIHQKSWFCSSAPLIHLPSFQWEEVFVVTYIIELISALTHTQWQPSIVKLQGSESDVVKSILPSHCRLAVEQEATAVYIPNDVLAMPISLSLSIDAPVTIEWHTSFTDSVFEVLRPYVKERNLSLEEAAHLLNFSVRTFQRNLTKENTSFRKIKENLMFTVACELMEEGHNLTYISNQLGYHDISKFSRAFKRVSGLTPSVYKKSIVGLHS